jgi:hypothetical protein
VDGRREELLEGARVDALRQVGPKFLR